MANSFKRAFFVLLTSLFVSAMPLQAAYANTHTTETTLNLVGSPTTLAAADVGPSNEAPVCVTYEGSITPDLIKTVVGAGGTIVDLTGPEAKAFQSRLEDLVGSPAPYQADRIVLVKPNGSPDTDYNVGLFVDNCLKTVLRLPDPAIKAIFGTKDHVTGERVD